jgi:hypothetical protein
MLCQIVMELRGCSRLVLLEMPLVYLLCRQHNQTMAGPSIILLTDIPAYLFDHGLVQVLQAAVTGLEPEHPYMLWLNPNGTGTLEPLQQFMTNPAGSAIVNTVSPIRQILQDSVPPRYLVIVPGTR